MAPSGLELSSGASVSGSSANSSQEEDLLKALPAPGADYGEDEDADDSTQTGALIQGVFGTLFTISKEREISLPFVIFKLLMDFWQLFVLVVSPQYGFNIEYNSKAWQIINVAGLNQFMEARGYTFFIAMLYVFVALLLVVFAVSTWVTQAFRSNRFDHVWPIVFLRAFSLVFFQVLDVMSVSLFLIALNCNYFDVPEEVQYTLKEFPDVQCWETPHLIHVAAASLSLVLFLGLATLAQMGEMELNPVTRNPMAMAHSKIEVIAFGLRMAMTLIETFITNDKWLAALMCICSWCLFFIFWKWNPHVEAWVNYCRSGFYACIFYCSVCLCFVVYKPDVDKSNPAEVADYQRTVTVALYAGIAPAGLVGAFAAWLRLRYFTVTVLNKFRDADPGTRPRFIHLFKSSLEVEIVARCCRRWVSQDVLDEGAVNLAEQVLKAGLAELPNDAFMVILYSSFLIDVQGSYQSGYTLLQSAKKLDPSFLERFAIFSREQQHTQKASKGGQAADLVSYVEFQRNRRLALKAHGAALNAIRDFWKKLLRRDVSFSDLEFAIAKIDMTVKNAERVYRIVVQRHGNSWQLLRMYARFLEAVKNDPWSASKWSAQAEELFAAEEDAKNNVFADLDDAMANQESDGEDDNEAVKRARALKAHMEDARGVIIINAQAIIVTANQAAHDMFGYAKKELRGKNVKVVIPSPFSDHHDSFIRRYVTTGKASIMGVTTEFVGLHKERHVFPLYLCVTKVSGVGEDSMFMGTLETIQATPGTAKAWVMTNGSVVSVDAAFSDWFGYKPADLLGSSLSSLVVEHQRLQDFLKMVKAKDMRFTSESTNTLIDQKFEIGGLHLKHKFAEPQEVAFTVTNGGRGSHCFYILHISRADTMSRHMLVADKRGRINHCTEDLAHMLGYTPLTIMASGVVHAMDNILPQPFASLHHSYLREAQTPLPPPYSCRSHLPMGLVSKTVEGKELLPFSMSVKKREEMGQVFHVVTMEEVSWDAAFDARRLRIYVDPRGNIVKASRSPVELFGFFPAHLVGLSCGEIIDALSTGGNSSLIYDPVLKAAAAETNSEELQLMLLQLARLATAQPGMSWRVGVHAPRENVVLDPIAAQLALSQRKTRAAIMTVNLHLGGSRELATEMGSVSGKPSKGGLLLELNLWRADLLAGVLEVDSHGKIVGTNEHKLYPPGLVFGVPNEALKGKHISRLLPVGERPVTDLFEAGLAARKGAIKSRLKKSHKPVDGKAKKPGRLNVLKATHLADGTDLELSVQAVWKWGMSGNAYIIVHPHLPKAATSNWTEMVSKASKDRFMTYTGPLTSPRSPRPGEPLPLIKTNADADDSAYGHQLSKTNLTVRSGASISGAGAVGGVSANARKVVRWGGDDDEPEAVPEEPEPEPEGSEGGGSEAEAEAAAAAATKAAKTNASSDQLESGSQASSSHHSGNESGEEEMVDQTDYRRGQRFKKLQRLLASTAVHRTMQRFKVHTLAVVGAVFVAHIAAFSAITILIKQQQQAVRDLNSMGAAAYACMECADAIRMADIYITGINDVTQTKEDAAAMLKWHLDALDYNIARFKELNAGTYLGFGKPKQLPATNGTRDLWDLPKNNVTMFYPPLVPGGRPIQEKVLMSMWDITNLYIKKLVNLAANWETIAETNNPYNRTLNDHPDLMFVIRAGVDTIIPGYYATLDTMVEEVLGEAGLIEQVQLMLLAIEGCALTGIVVLYMWALSTHVAMQRHSLYSVFMVLPQGLVRGLANKALIIEDNDRGDGGMLDDPPPPYEAQEAQEEVPNTGPNLIKIQVAQTEETGLVRRMMSSAMFWRASQNAGGFTGSKRKLRRSYRRTLWLVVPFMVWGAMIIAINVTGHAQMNSIDSPIATFNLVNFVIVRVYRLTYRLVEIPFFGGIGDYERQEFVRSELPGRLYLIWTEYKAMLYGGSATPQEKSPHFTRAKLGVIFMGTQGADLLYRKRGCLNPDPWMCLNPGTSMYEMSRHGIDMMMQRYLEHAEAMARSKAPYPTPSDVMFNETRVAHNDLIEGLYAMNAIYEAAVQDVYLSTLTMHIVGLVLTCVLLAAYLWFILKPFMAEAAAESKRIAELLTQLPPEVDVEGLLRATLIREARARNKDNKVHPE